MRLGTPVMAVRWSVREVQSTCRQLWYLCVLLLADLTDLREVRSAVVDLAGRWQDLGVSLGIQMGDLDAILSDNVHPSDCMRRMLILWLRQHYNVRVWTSLIPYCSFLPSWHGELVIRGRTEVGLGNMEDCHKPTSQQCTGVNGKVPYR